jgi:glycerophosphoryl diester phosphodiesterase
MSRGPGAARSAGASRTRRLHRPSWPSAPGWLRQPLAHRGLHAPDGPAENTLEAFAAARDAGYGVELDVRLSADGIPVVHHDAHLADGRALAAVPSGALPAHVPTLAAALDVLRRVPVMVEVKQEGLRPRALARATGDVLDGHDGTSCVASFHPGTLLRFARDRPAIVRVFAVTDQPDAPVGPRLRDRLASLEHLALLRPHAVSFDVRGLPTPATTRWREYGGLVTTWTVHDAPTLATARAHADGMIFEGLRP